ncbi:hypothetical protein ACFLZA_01305 [Candidatus Neomarinimicrobiota bacterium]
MKKSYLVLIPVLYLSLIYSQSVEIKDSSDQLLLQVNDEGENNSSLTLPSSGTVPTSTTNKLYNHNGILKWKDISLSTSLYAAGGWKNLAGEVYLINSSDNVGIGSTNPASKLTVGTTSGNSIINVYSKTDLSNGEAIRGYAASETGANYGGRFIAAGNEAHAVHGHASHTSGINYAISGYTNSTNGWAGYFDGRGYYRDNVGIGTTNPLSKLSVGGDGLGYAAIYGIMNGGTGVYGNAIGSVSYGVFGKTSGSSGYGVYGLASNTSGTNYGVYGQTMSGSGWAGYFDGRGYFSNKVGIGTITPQATLHVNDLVMIEPSKEPTSSQEGMIYYDSDTHKLRVHNGTAWINLH